MKKHLSLVTAAAIPVNEAARLKALQDYEILDTTVNEIEFKRIAELATIACDTPVALVSLLDENRQWIKSAKGVDIREISRKHSFCQYTLMQDAIFEIEDTTCDRRFNNSELPAAIPGARFYCGYPLIDPLGYNLGTISVIDYKPRRLNEKQKKALVLLAQEIIDLIVKRRQKDELMNFGNLFELSPDLICIAKSDGTIIKANPALEKLLGIAKEQLLSFSFFDLIHEDDLEATRNQIANLYGNATVLNFVIRIKTINGQYRSIQWAASLKSGTDKLFAVGRDLTEEISAESKLIDSETRLRAFFENSQGLMSTHDLEGKFLTVNAAGADKLGYTVAEIMTRTLFDLVPLEHQAGVDAYLLKIRTDGAAKGQLTIRHKSGSLKIWMFSNILERSTNGEWYIIANAVDITERYALERRLLRTTKMLEETNQVAKIGGWQADMINRKLYWTSVTKELHGVPADYKPDLETAINFYKAGENRDIISDAVEKAIKYGTPWNLELQLENCLGKELWVRAIGKAEMKNGVCQRIYGTFQDIDERKKIQIEISKSRAILSAFVQHVPAAVAMVDKDMRYVAASNKWLQDYSIRDSNVIDISYYETFPSIAEEFKERHRRVLQGTIERDDEYEIILPGSQEKRYISWEMRPWYYLDHSIGGMMVFTQDITRVVQQRKQLVMAKAEAEAASKTKSEFLANMSHEIRTPLNGIIGFLDLVLKTNLSTTQRQYLSIVGQSAKTLLAIINDILDFSKIEAGKLELDIEQLDIYEMAAQATDLISYQVQKKGLEMLLNVEPELPRFILADSVRLKQVLVNLLSNAVKFTEQGEIELQVEQQAKEGDEITIRFRVRDTGIGIKKEKQQKIFEAFSQEDGYITKKYGGTGLGLTISNKLLEMMGSALKLESEPREGSSFFFDIKSRLVDTSPLSQVKLSTIKTVLLIDDNEHNRSIICKMLQQEDIGIIQAGSGFEALHLLAEGKVFDVIIIDYQMPFMNGIETIGKIRKMFHSKIDKQHIILLSDASDDEMVAERCETLEVNDRLFKPVKMADLYNTLSRLNQKKLDNKEAHFFSQIALSDSDITILIAEDNTVNMLLAEKLINSILPNAKVIKALNGMEAIAQFVKHAPELIFMDVQMPEMNGIEAARKIRQLETTEERAIIVALTASSLTEEKDKCLAAGMNDFVAKPITEAFIAQTLNHWLTEIIHYRTIRQKDKPDVHFEREKMESYFGNDPEIISDVIKLVRIEMGNYPRILYNLIEMRHLEDIKALGHKIRGTALSAAMPLIIATADKLEHLESFNYEVLMDLYNKLDKEIKIVLSLIDVIK